MNQQPSACKADALPIELQPHVLLTLTMVELSGVAPESASHSDSVILRDLLYCLYSFETLVELLLSEVLVVSQLTLAQASQVTLFDY